MTENGLKVIDRRMVDEPETAVQLADNSPASMMIAAMSKGMDLDKLERLLEIQKQWEANEARKAYYEAVSAFKENPPEVLKDKENSQFSKGDKKAMYVSLGNLLKTVNPALGKHGLSASYEIDQGEKLIAVTCKLSHRMGHSESVRMEAPPDASGGNAKNPIQQIKSTVTYLKAATFEAVTGLAATDANLDDDGNAAGTDYIDDKQLSRIMDYIDNYDVNVPKFLAYMGVQDTKEIPAKQFNKAIAGLEAQKAAVERARKEGKQ